MFIVCLTIIVPTGLKDHEFRKANFFFLLAMFFGFGLFPVTICFVVFKTKMKIVVTC